MGVLHLVSRSPGESQAFAQCLARVGEGDALVLLEGGVYAALAGHADALALRQVEIYAVSADLAARGIAEEALAEGVAVVDYAGLVELSLRHSPSLSWL
ncbi:MAG: sulfurtransferase complex subunit TusB [Candidatus Methylumidiphilus sp.]